jgi:hypothetical protein
MYTSDYHAYMKHYTARIATLKYGHDIMHSAHGKEDLVLAGRAQERQQNPVSVEREMCLAVPGC